MNTLLQSKGTKPRTGQVLKCNECAAPFYRRPAKVSGSRFCSRSCRHTNLSNRVEAVEKPCATCGKLMVGKPHQLRRKERCSVACKHRYLSQVAKERLGERASNWRGGVTSRNLLHRSSLRAKAWTRRIMERDGFRCRDCGSNTNALNAHHILPWADFPDLRYELWNGEALCQPCHLNTHTLIRSVEVAA